MSSEARAAILLGAIFSFGVLVGMMMPWHIHIALQ